MADNPDLQQRIAMMKQAFFDEGILDQEQWTTIEELDNEDNPDFVECVIGIFLRDSTRYIDSIESLLNTHPIDPANLDRTLYRLKGSSASIGAIKINIAVNETRGLCTGREFESAKVVFERLKTEQASFKAKFEAYCELLKEAKSAKGQYNR